MIMEDIDYKKALRHTEIFTFKGLNTADGCSIKLKMYYGKQDDYWVCYCPGIEVSSYGINLQEAKKGFFENLHTYFSDILSL